MDTNPTCRRSDVPCCRNWNRHCRHPPEWQITHANVPMFYVLKWTLCVALPTGLFLGILISLALKALNFLLFVWFLEMIAKAVK